MGRWSREGRRYWPMVRMSQPAAARSRKTASSSCGLFAQADHDAGFRHACRVQFLGVTQQIQSAFVARAGADDAIEARHGFGVVVQHFGARVDDHADGFAVALEVGDEHFDAAAGRVAANLLR